MCIWLKYGLSLFNHLSAPEALDDEDIAVQLASVQDVQAYLAHADDNSVKALVHLDPEALHSADEREMYETLHRLEMERGRRTPVPDDVLDRSPASLASSPRKLGSSPLASVLETEEQNDVWYGVFFLGDAVPTPVVVMVGACILSLLALGCVATVLYTAEILKKSVFRSDAAWGVLGKLETSGRRRAGMDAGLEHEKIGVTEKQHLPTAPPPVFRIGRMDAEKPADDDDGTAETETDETFFDAEWADNASDSAKSTPYATPLVHALDLPQPPQPSHSSNAASYETTDTGMSELALALPGALPSPSRPAWSLRASESKIHPDQAGLTPPTPAPAPTHPRTRRPYNAHAELDAALAMQLRPGLGLGADAAWLVRFVMAVFGWCAVLITSTNGAAPRRRGAA